MARMRGGIRPDRRAKGVVSRAHGRSGASSGTGTGCNAADKAKAKAELRRTHSFNPQTSNLKPQTLSSSPEAGRPRSSRRHFCFDSHNRSNRPSRSDCVISEAARGRPGLDWLWLLAVAGGGTPIIRASSATTTRTTKPSHNTKNNKASGLAMSDRIGCRLSFFFSPFASSPVCRLSLNGIRRS